MRKIGRPRTRGSEVVERRSAGREARVSRGEAREEGGRAGTREDSTTESDEPGEARHRRLIGMYCLVAECRMASFRRLLQ